MWGIALLLYAFLKVLTWLFRRRAPAAAWKHCAYLLAWPGMDVDTFLHVRAAKCPSMGEWLFAAGKFSFGLVIITVVCSMVATLGSTVVGWTGMLGIVFSLHFGLFHLLSCLWRSLGIEARPIMNWPICACSPADFWGRRWNLAFRDLTNRFVFQPSLRRLGPATALLTGFVASGLIHDLVISVPAGGGYGLPTLYFTLQGVAVLFQHRNRRASREEHAGPGSRLVTAALLVLPSPLIFHGWFIHRVIVPFLHTISVVR